MVQLLDISKELDKNPEWSLEPDPTGLLHLTEKEKTYVRLSTQYSYFSEICEIAGWSDEEMAEVQVFRTDSRLWKEGMRIRRAYAARRLASRVLTLDEIASFLSTMVTGIGVPEKDQLTPSGKLQAIRLIYEYYALKADSGRIIDVVNSADDELDQKVSQLTTEELKLLIANKESFIATLKQVPVIKGEGTLSETLVTPVDPEPVIIEPKTTRTKTLNNKSYDELTRLSKQKLIDYLNITVVDMKNMNLNQFTKKELLSIFDKQPKVGDE